MTLYDDKRGMKLDWSCGELAAGVRCYRNQEFFDAHEHWEAVWLKSQEPEKTFLQALIQVAAAFHHLQRSNRAGAVSLLRAALRRLETFPDPFEGIAVTPVRDDISSCLRALEGEESLSGLSFPRI